LNWNSLKDQECYYGFYTHIEGLSPDVHENDCSKSGTKFLDYNDSTLTFCKEHYPIVKQRKQQKPS
jgi:hypothetical protein